MSYVQIPHAELMAGKTRFCYSVANILLPATWFEAAGIQFHLDEEDNLLAIIRFSSGEVGLLGTARTQRDRGIELFSVGAASSMSLLTSLRSEFKDIKDGDIQMLERPIAI